MNIGLITTVQPERCGLRIYSEELASHVVRQNPDIHFEMVGRPFDFSLVDRCRRFDVVHVMHVQSLFQGFTTDHVRQLKAIGKKVICTFHDSMSDNRSEFTLAFDKVIVHQPTIDGFTYIYHGVPDKPVQPNSNKSEFVGTSGFPLPFKNYGLAARLAKGLGMKLWACLPSSLHGDVDWVEREIQEACPGSVVRKDFPSHDEILDELSGCLFTIFPYRHETTGVGGSMRVGIGAQRPVVISNVVRFIDVLSEKKFRDEFYVIDSAYPTFENSFPVVAACRWDIERGQAKVPIKTLEAMSWTAASQRYVEVYRELMASKSEAA